MRYRSGPFEFDSNDACLRGPAGEVRLRKQLALTLTLLWQRAPALVTLDDLLDEVWGRRAISASAVPQVIGDLRRALGDNAQSSAFLETRHRLGYRWMLPVVSLPEEVPAPAIGELDKLPALPELAEGQVDDIDAAAARRSISVAPLGSRHALLYGALIVAVTAAALGWWRAAILDSPMVNGERSAAAMLLQNAARTAFDAYDFDQALIELDRLQHEQASDAILRAQIAHARADAPAARLALNHARSMQPTAIELKWIAALEASVDGHEVDAGKSIDTLLQITPDDPALSLLALEHRKRLPKPAIAALTTRLVQQSERFPPARQAILRIQLAGLANEPERQMHLAQEYLHDVETLKNPLVRAQMQLLLAESLERLGKRPEAEAAALSAAEAFHAAGALRFAVRAMSRACSVAIDIPDYERVERHIARTLAWLENGHDPAGLAAILHYQAMLYNRREQFAQAVRAYAEQAARYEALGDLAFAATSLNSSAHPLYLLGRGNEIPAVLERAFVLASQANAGDTAGYVLGSLANHYVRVGDLTQAGATYQRALEQFRAAGLKDAEMTALGNLGELATMQGRLSDAARYFSAAAVLQQASGDMNALAYSERRQAEVESALGNLAAATQHAQSAVARYKSISADNEEASARRVLVVLQLRQAQLQAAQLTLDEGTRLAQSGPAANAELSVIRGSIAFEQGRLGDAERAFVAALKLRGDTQEAVDRSALELSILEVRLARGEHIAVEEESRRLLARPDVRDLSPTRRRAQRLLLQALIAENRQAESRKALTEMDALLEQAPDAEDALRVALYRSALDKDPLSAGERLEWVQKEADRNGMRLLALETQGEALRRNPGRNTESWRKAVIATGMTRLLALPNAIASN